MRTWCVGDTALYPFGGKGTVVYVLEIREGFVAFRFENSLTADIVQACLLRPLSENLIQPLLVRQAKDQ